MQLRATFSQSQLQRQAVIGKRIGKFAYSLSVSGAIWTGEICSADMSIFISFVKKEGVRGKVEGGTRRRERTDRRREEDGSRKGEEGAKTPKNPTCSPNQMKLSIQRQSAGNDTCTYTVCWTEKSTLW